MEQDVSALWYDEVEHNVYAVVGGGRILGWALDGTQILDWQPTTVLNAYPHHEVQLVDGVIYMIAARERTIDGRHLVEDGIEGYDLEGNLVYSWWAHEDGGMSPTDNPPVSWEAAGTGYWAEVFPTAGEWLHANSLQVREEGGVMKAYVDFRDCSRLVPNASSSCGSALLLAQPAHSTGPTQMCGIFLVLERGRPLDATRSPEEKVATPAPTSMVTPTLQ